MKHPPLTQYPNNSEEIQNRFGHILNKKYAAVLDLELTCWENIDLTRTQAEITEIGVALVDLISLEIINTFSKTVRPIYNPELTEYCKNLTGISQDEINCSDKLENVYKDLVKNFLPNEKEFCWVTWGRDSIQLEQELNLKYKGTKSVKLDPRILNFKEFTRNLKINGGLKDCLESLGIDQELPRHRALPDAISTAKLLKYFNVSNEDIMISNSYSYKQAVNRFREDQKYKFSKQLHISLDKSEKILQLLDWNFTKAKAVFQAVLDR